MSLAPAELSQRLALRWPHPTSPRLDESRSLLEFACAREDLPKICEYLFDNCGFSFASLIAEESATEWQLRYVFYGGRGTGWTHLRVAFPLREATLPSIVREVHAADWHEREVEDLFGITFAGHPRLGDFVLHDDAWQEGVAPMRRRFDASAPLQHQPRADWRPLRVLQEPGAFVMPIGPIFAGATESVHFDLETVGEDVIRAVPRLFFKYRGVEKIAEGADCARALALAERFAATTALSHAFGFAQAVESIAGIEPPPRARWLRIFLAELERMRHHIGALAAICASTALNVAASQMALLEEDLLRISCALTGHRYLFGLVIPGGLACDFAAATCAEALRGCQRVAARMAELEKMLRVSSSFLDRLEEVGVIAEKDAREVGLVGPMARASGIDRDLRHAHPYGGYDALEFTEPTEREGDGYARLRVLFAEAHQALHLMEQAAARLAPGPVALPVRLRAGAALGFIEGPRGAETHWVRLDEDGSVLRYHVTPPSFLNWLGFHLAVERFAFQDFPIILATLDLSVAETDR